MDWLKSVMAVAITMLLAACVVETPALEAPPPSVEPYVQIDHPDWARDAVIYQINLRQFTDEGTIAAAQAQLPRLADLGADILWLMPVHPIGERNRKGVLGSPYAVKDYYGVNPDLGALEDLKAFVAEAQGLGMKVILDWVANHTAWDAQLVIENPDWFVRGPDGAFTPPIGTDWDDVIQLDFTNPDVRRYMIDAMVYWVRDVGVDGFRADVAERVPLGFWEALRADLDAIKPVFLLAEAEFRDLHARAFNATYAWTWKDAMQAVARGDADASALANWHHRHNALWPADGYRLLYTANHDQNSWDGTARDIYGRLLEAAIVLSFTSPGIPLIYNGQEAGLDKQLAFFDRDPIEWDYDAPLGALFAELITLKTETKALANGAEGAPSRPIANTAPTAVFSFARVGETDGVLVLVNTTRRSVAVELPGLAVRRFWTDVFDGGTTSIGPDSVLLVEPYGFRVLRWQS